MTAELPHHTQLPRRTASAARRLAVVAVVCLGLAACSSTSNSPSNSASCPTAAELEAVLQPGDGPVSGVSCASDLGVGTYAQAGKNQVTGVWRNAGGTWQIQERATVCAQADDLPDELYTQACTDS